MILFVCVTGGKVSRREQLNRAVMPPLGSVMLSSPVGAMTLDARVTVVGLHRH